MKFVKSLTSHFKYFPGVLLPKLNKVQAKISKLVGIQKFENKQLSKFNAQLVIFLTFVFIGAILFSSIRGFYGNPDVTQLRSQMWSFDGPLELSPERGRYALMLSIVEHGTPNFPLDIAKFATPDLGYIDGKYVSLFAPAVSFIAAPGYVLGKLAGASQVGTFAVITLFALLNCILIFKIGVLLNSKYPAALIAVFAFIFGTPAYTYSVAFYQHHISTFLILLSLFLLIRYKNLLSIGIVWFLCAFSISVDYPNLFMMLPLGVFALTKFINITQKSDKYILKINSTYLLSFLFAIFPTLFFLWFNKVSYGNPLTLAGSVTQVREIGEDGLPADTNFTAGINKATPGQDIADLLDEEKKVSQGNTARNPVKFFNTRGMLNGLYILIFSPDRGTVAYAPIILIGILGIFIYYKENTSLNNTLIAIILMCLILYSMWGDPWGGWAFGARYLIPAYAILAIYLGIFLSKIKRKYFIFPVLLLFLYSSYINTIGALTSNAIPPKVEVLALEELSGIEQKYSYKRDLDILKSGYSKSFIYNHFFKDNTHAMHYFYYVYGSIAFISGCISIYYIMKSEKNNN